MFSCHVRSTHETGHDSRVTDGSRRNRTASRRLSVSYLDDARYAANPRALPLRPSDWHKRFARKQAPSSEAALARGGRGRLLVGHVLRDELLRLTHEEGGRVLRVARPC